MGGECSQDGRVDASRRRAQQCRRGGVESGREGRARRGRGRSGEEGRAFAPLGRWAFGAWRRTEIGMGTWRTRYCSIRLETTILYPRCECRPVAGSFTPLCISGHEA